MPSPHAAIMSPLRHACHLVHKRCTPRVISRLRHALIFACRFVYAPAFSCHIAAERIRAIFAALFAIIRVDI